MEATRYKAHRKESTRASSGATAVGIIVRRPQRPVEVVLVWVILQ